MNNLKKIGLTALAGSLVAVSANAGELSVSGSAEYTYTDNNGSTGSGNNITGNPWGAQQLVVFTGSGDVGFGELTVVRAQNDDNSSNSTSYSTLNMGDMGTLSFDSNGYGGVGYAANDDILPTAYEEIWNGTNADSGVAGAGSNNTLGYANTIGPVSFSVGYQKDGPAANQSESSASGAGVTGSTTDYYASIDMGAIGVDGLTIGAGMNESTQNSAALTDADTTHIGGNVNYTMGSVSLGYRSAQKNVGTAATASEKITGMAIAFNVNESFAVSYGQQTTERDSIGGTATNQDEEVTGINASYTMGAASIRLSNSVVDNEGFTANQEEEHTEISVVLSF